MIGRNLGHYPIEEKLGEGGMGVVYKARDTHLDRFAAIKLLPREKVADPERKRRFVQEAKAASALNHPNIIVIHDIARAGVARPGYPLRGLATPGGPQGTPQLIGQDPVKVVGFGLAKPAEPTGAEGTPRCSPLVANWRQDAP